MFKHNGGLYLLVTDEGYGDEASVVWEKLDEIDGDTEYCDSSFVVDNQTGGNEMQANDPAASLLASCHPMSAPSMAGCSGGGGGCGGGCGKGRWQGRSHRCCPGRRWRRAGHLHKLLGLLAHSQGLHQGFPNQHGEVRAAEALRVRPHLVKVVRLHRVGGVSEVEAGHGGAGGSFREGNVDAFFESAPDGGVELPRDVGRTQH
mmetsp:Transcript_10607/g.19559  ORF Transcript_10607/g.19559 Transcript_10607/m.19559 type:complete len:203 (+) Transcript_10607:318-926(+)